MIYSKKEISQKLKEELDKGYNLTRISNWAFDVYITIRNDPTEVNSILERLSLMDAGTEFEYNEADLRLLVDLLNDEIENPLDRIDDLKFK